MSSDEEDRMHFGISEHDIENEFNTGRKRPKRSKNDALYGVFNDSEEDEQAQEDGRKRSRFIQPMAFVSGSAAAAAAKASDDGSGSGSESDTDKIDDVILSAPQAEVKANSQAKPSATPAFVQEQKPLNRAQRRAQKFGTVPPKAVADPFKDPAPARGGLGSGGGGLGGGPASGTPSYSSFGVKNGTAKVSKEFGAWEKSTRGIGMKLLMKMGYKKGGGLGAHGQGMANPVDVKKRTGNMGLQDSGERTKQSRVDFPTNKGEPTKEEAFQAELQKYRGTPQWKKKGKRGRKNEVKYQFERADEIASKASAAGYAAGQTSLTIIDMTGPGGARKVGSDKIASGALSSNLPVLSGADGTVPMPELQYNINQQLTWATESVRRTSSKIKISENKRVGLAQEQVMVAQRIAKRSGHINRLKQIIDIVDTCRSRISSKSSSIEFRECLNQFALLKKDFPEEFSVYGLTELVAAVCQPIIKDEFEDWQALAEPAGRVDKFKQCCDLLMMDSEPQRKTAPQLDEPLTLIETICESVIVPRFRRALTDDWRARDSASAIDLLETWRPLLPTWIFTNILEMIVMPRLKVEVDTWNPLTDQMMIHAWLHPWLPVLGKYLESLYPTIRFKLAMCLRSWMPNDESARLIILPWKGVFAPHDMSSFLAKAVVPKLAQQLRQFVINPQQQDLQGFHQVMTWRNLLSLEAMVQVLDECFLPKLLNVLCEWLSSPNPNFEEISSWYTGWKQELDGELLAAPAIKARLARALDLMNRALTGGPIQGSYFNAPTPPQQQYQRPVAQPPRVKMQASVSIRDLVQREADKHGVVFVPRPDKNADGKSVYGFGKAYIYIERDVVYAKSQGDGYFLPVSIDQLASRAR